MKRGRVVNGIVVAVFVVVFLTSSIVASSSERLKLTLEDVGDSGAYGEAKFQRTVNRDGTYGVYLDLKIKNLTGASWDVYEVWMVDEDSSYVLSLGAFKAHKRKEVKREHGVREKHYREGKKISKRFRQTQVNSMIYDKIVITRENVSDLNPFPDFPILEAEIPGSIHGNEVDIPWCVGDVGEVLDFDYNLAIMYKSVTPFLGYNHTSGIENHNGTGGVLYREGFWGEFESGISFGENASGDWNYQNITYEWLEIRESGVPLGLDDDEFSDEIALPFNVSVLGEAKNEVKVSSNGFLTFEFREDDDGCCNGEFIPDPSTPNDIVAGFWVDLDPGNSGEIYYQTLGTAPNRKFVVEFDGITHYADDTLPEFFQFVFYESAQS